MGAEREDVAAAPACAHSMHRAGLWAAIFRCLDEKSSPGFVQPQPAQVNSSAVSVVALRGVAEVAPTGADVSRDAGDSGELAAASLFRADDETAVPGSDDVDWAEF